MTVSAAPKVIWLHDITDEGLCAGQLLEQTRCTVSAAYRKAARETRAWRVEAATAREAWENATTARSFFPSLATYLVASFEHHWAKKKLNWIIPHLPEDEILARLGWDKNNLPACARQQATPTLQWNAQRLLPSLFVAASFIATPPALAEIKATGDHALMFGSICQTITPGQTPIPLPKAPCCNPREALQLRRKL